MAAISYVVYDTDTPGDVKEILYFTTGVTGDDVDDAALEANYAALILTDPDDIADVQNNTRAFGVDTSGAPVLVPLTGIAAAGNFDGDGEWHAVDTVPAGSEVRCGTVSKLYPAGGYVYVRSTTPGAVHLDIIAPFPDGPGTFDLTFDMGNVGLAVKAKKGGFSFSAISESDAPPEPGPSPGDQKPCYGEPPDGWVWCDGTAYERATYPDLFEALTARCQGDITSASAVITNVTKDFSGAAVPLTAGAFVEVYSSFTYAGTPLGSALITAVTSTTITQAFTFGSSAADSFLRVVPADVFDAAVYYQDGFKVPVRLGHIIYLGTAGPDQTIRFDMPGVGLVQIDKFTANGTYRKPSWAKQVRAILLSGSSGGGSGARRAAGVASSGGGGGAGATYVDVIFPASVVAATETVTVGAAGVGGAAVTANDTNGNPGTAGGTSFFGTLARAAGTNPGAGGTTTTASGGTCEGQFGVPPAPAAVGGTGNNASAGGTGNQGYGLQGGHGGGGGGVSAADAASAGGPSAAPSRAVNTSASNTAGGAVDTAGADGAATTQNALHGSPAGGGGGGSSSAAAGRGGDGAAPGGGGGGGGGSRNGNSSGRGGHGARGEVWVISIG